MKKILAAFVMMLAVGTVGAKGRTVKLTIAGPGLLHSVDVTAPDAVAANPWANNFADAQPVPAPPRGLARYEVSFYEELESRNVKKMYVVTYSHDPSTGQGFIYFPGPRDPWYRLNIGTIYNEGQNGTWHRAFEPWSRAVAAALPKNSTPASR